MKGHKVSVRDVYLGPPSTTVPPTSIHDNPKNPAVLDLWDKMGSCFDLARKLSGSQLIPYPSIGSEQVVEARPVVHGINGIN